MKLNNFHNRVSWKTGEEKSHKKLVKSKHGWLNVSLGVVVASMGLFIGGMSVSADSSVPVPDLASTTQQNNSNSVNNKNTVNSSSTSLSQPSNNESDGITNTSQNNISSSITDNQKVILNNSAAADNSENNQNDINISEQNNVNHADDTTLNDSVTDLPNEDNYNQNNGSVDYGSRADNATENNVILHHIEYGDTVWEYSQKYGSSIDAIANLNQLANPNLIYAGNFIYIPVDYRSVYAATNNVMAVTNGTWGTAPYTYDDATDTLTLLGGGVIPSGKYTVGDYGESTLPFPNVKHIVVKGKVALSPESSWSFAGLKQLEDVQGANYIDSSNSTNMVGLFANNPMLKTLGLNFWNVSKVNSFGLMFGGDSNLSDVNFQGWDTSNTKYFNLMFKDATSLTRLDLSMFDTRKTDLANRGMYGMFTDTPKLWDLVLGNNTFIAPNSDLQNPSTNQPIPGTSRKTAGPSWQLVGDGNVLNPKGAWVNAKDIMDFQSLPYEYVWAQTTDTKVKYIDSTTGQQVGDITDLGYQDPGIDITSVVVQGIPFGYELVNPQANYYNGTYATVDENGVQTINVMLTDQLIPATPDHPVAPNTPVDPSKPVGPDNPIIPAGGDVTDLTHDVTRTIHYRDAEGNTVAPDVVQTVHFERTGTYNVQTGKWTYTPWTSKNDEFSAVTSPVLSAYGTPDQTVVAAEGNVPETASNSEIVVTYTNVQPQPEPNPAPQPQPQPEPDPAPQLQPQPEPEPQSATEIQPAVELRQQAQPEGPIENSEQSNQKSNKKDPKLPQTGQSQSFSLIGLIGMILTMISGLFGMILFRKKR